MLFEIIPLDMSQEAGMMPTMTPHADECLASLPGVFQHPEEIKPLIFLDFAGVIHIQVSQNDFHLYSYQGTKTKVWMWMAIVPKPSLLEGGIRWFLPRMEDCPLPGACCDKNCDNAINQQGVILKDECFLLILSRDNFALSRLGYFLFDKWRKW